MNNNENFYDKLDVYNLEYTDATSVLTKAVTGKSKENDDERYVATAAINPNEESILDFISASLLLFKSVKKRTIGIDYRLLTDDIVNLLEEAYLAGTITGIRLLPEGKLFTKEMFDKFNKDSFTNFLLCADNISKEIDTKSTKLDIRNQKGIGKIEHIVYDNCQKKNQCTRVNNYNIHITRKLNSEEIRELAILLSENNYDKLYVDFYEPSYYKKLITELNESNIKIPVMTEICFLGNPLYDNLNMYCSLNSVLNNKITIRYNTCNDLNNFYKAEPYSEGANYFSDIEASGITDVTNYNNMLKEMDKVIRHMEERNYSPLEKVTYLHDYFIKNYVYDETHASQDIGDTRDLDKVYYKGTMICEGFSNLFSAILRRAGLLCFTYGTDDHQKNIIRITDSKYNVDNISIIDVTFDIGNSTEKQLDNFLLDMDNDLYSPYSEVISIPTSLFITGKTYNDNINFSNPVYETNPIGYAIRMLELMGLSIGDRKFDSLEELHDFYRDAIQNSGLAGSVSETAIADALTHIRRTEGIYSTESEEKQAREKILVNLKYRNNGKVLPAIKLLDNSTVPADVHTANPNNKFTVVEAQNSVLKKPRDKRKDETIVEYNEYLQEFYQNTFIVDAIRPEIEQENITSSNQEKPKEKVKKQELPITGNEKISTSEVPVIGSEDITSVINEAVEKVNEEVITPEVLVIGSEDITSVINDAVEKVNVEVTAENHSNEEVVEPEKLLPVVVPTKETTSEKLTNVEVVEQEKLLPAVAPAKEAKVKPSFFNKLANGVKKLLGRNDIKEVIDGKLANVEVVESEKLLPVVVPTKETTSEKLTNVEVVEPEKLLPAVVPAKGAKVKPSFFNKLANGVKKLLGRNDIKEVIDGELANVEVVEQEKLLPVVVPTKETTSEKLTNVEVVEQEKLLPVVVPTKETTSEKLTNVEVVEQEKLLPEVVPTKEKEIEPSIIDRIISNTNKMPEPEKTVTEDEITSPTETIVTDNQNKEETLSENVEKTEKVKKVRSEYTPMTAEEIEQARQNIDYYLYEEIYRNHKDELFEGTNICKPRDRRPHESDEEYIEFLRRYSDNYFENEQQEIKTEEVVEEVQETEEREEVASGYIYDGQDIVDVVREEHGIDLNDPEYSVGFDGATDDIYGPETQVTRYVVYRVKSKDLKNEYTPMTAEEIEQARQNIDYYLYEEIYSNHSNELIEGTNVYKPRDRRPYETDDEYIEYLINYYEKPFILVDEKVKVKR